MDLPLDRLIDDVARGIFPLPQIATRYSLTMAELHQLVSTPAVQKAMRHRKQVWQSDASLGERLETYSQAAAIEKLPKIINMIDDETVPTPLRVEALKFMGRSLGTQDRTGQSQGQSSAPFVINFNFANAPRESIATTIDQQALP
jgi:hypothetical protein